MPRKNFELFWFQPKGRKTGRWRKRYNGQTFYMKTECSGKRDTAGYRRALREWERVKAWQDGLSPCPYTESGVLIPEDQVLTSKLPYLPTAAPAPTQTLAPSNSNSQHVEPTRSVTADDPEFFIGRGFGAAEHSDAVVRNNGKNPYDGERRISALIQHYNDQRQRLADDGELSLKQWSEDKRQLQVFQEFTEANYTDLFYVRQISASVLNLYRDAQRDDCGSARTLKKRLDSVSKWLRWMVDEGILEDLPRDMSQYSRVSLPKGEKLFYTPDEVKRLYDAASEPLKLYILLAVNTGMTQREIATLEHDHIDWQTGILERPRNKTGELTRAKLWPITLRMLLKQRNPNADGPLLVSRRGEPLVVSRVNEKGKLAETDTIRSMFDRLRRDVGAGGKSFKHFRKTSANYIEKWDPALTSLFLSHAETGMKRAYVNQHFDELFKLTDRLDSEVFKLGKERQAEAA